MIRKLIFSSLLCFCAGITNAQKVFPVVSGRLLDGNPVSVPQQNGKHSLIAIAFHREAGEALKLWLQPLYDNFIKKESGDPFDIAEFYDVNFVFIPMIEGFGKIAEAFKSNTDKHYWPYILDTEKTDIRSLQQQLGIKDTKQPYFFVVDTTGRVVATTQGSFSEKKMEKLEEAIE